MFYFTLGNLPSKFQKLSAIQLVTISKTTILAIYGMDAVLHPFVDDLMKLVDNLHNYSIEGFDVSLTPSNCIMPT